MIDKNFLEELGITDEETIGKITTRYTQDVTAAGKSSGGGDNTKELKNTIKDWEKRYGDLEANKNKEIESIRLDHAIQIALSGAKAKNNKAVQALIDMENVKLTDGKVTGLDEQLKKIKADNEYLFESDSPKPKFVDKSNGGGAQTVTKEAFAAMGYRDRLKLKAEQPEAYNELTEKSVQ